MPGALMQLVSHGAADIYFTGNPQKGLAPYGLRPGSSINSNPTCPTLVFSHYPEIYRSEWVYNDINKMFEMPVLHGPNYFPVDKIRYEQFWSSSYDTYDYHYLYGPPKQGQLVIENDKNLQILPESHENWTSILSEKELPIEMPEYNPDIVA
jgi:hypothetical protein